MTFVQADLLMLAFPLCIFRSAIWRNCFSAQLSKHLEGPSALITPMEK